MIFYKLSVKKISKKIEIFPKGAIRGAKWDSELLRNCDTLSKMAPHFKVDSASIRILEEPSHFYEYLLDGVKNARERVFISALYIGTDPMSKKLISTIEKKCKKDQDVNINILIDYLRGTRMEKGESSKTMFEDMLANLKTFNKPKFHFFLSPAFTGIWKKILPKRFNETLGVQHIKCYIFDDKMMISGANLSKDYFTNRQDRYVEISDKGLTDFYWEMLHTISKNSFQINLQDDQKNQKDELRSSQDNNVLFRNQNPLNHREFITPSVNPSLEPEKFKSHFSSEIKAFFESEKWTSSVSYENQSMKDSTFIFPTVQLGVCNIRQDEDLTNFILSKVDSKSDVVITSGYFNLTDQYSNHLLRSNGKINAIAASPLANGFFGSKGLSRHIPYAYTELELYFLKMVEKHKKETSLTLNEYYRKDWTYHAKGVWLFREEAFFTLVGSANLGYRSINRDLESQILIASNDPSLQKLFRQESTAIQHYSSPVSYPSLNVPDRRSALWVRLLIHFVKRFM